MACHPREEPEINFIPLIDVLLVILIFLMVTTTYQRVAELQITLPGSRRRAIEAASEGNQHRRRRARPIRDRPERFPVHHGQLRSPKRSSRAAAGDARTPVVIINADANADPPVGDSRDGSRTAGGLDSHHIRNANHRQ